MSIGIMSMKPVDWSKVLKDYGEDGQQTVREILKALQGYSVQHGYSPALSVTYNREARTFTINHSSEMHAVTLSGLILGLFKRSRSWVPQFRYETDVATGDYLMRLQPKMQ